MPAVVSPFWETGRVSQTASRWPAARTRSWTPLTATARRVAAAVSSSEAPSMSRSMLVSAYLSTTDW